MIMKLGVRSVCLLIDCFGEVCEGIIRVSICVHACV